MQQRPGGRERYTVRAKRTQPALPGATLPTTPVSASSQLMLAGSDNIGTRVTHKRPQYARRAALWLCITGVCITFLLLALYPLLANATYGNTATVQAITGLFPWVTRLYWSPSWVGENWLSTHVSLFDPATTGGNANLFAVLFGLAFILSLLAMQVGIRVTKKRLERADVRLLFSVTLLFTALFGLIACFAPGGMTRDMFQYGLYGRMVAVYHVNPFVVSAVNFPHDIMQQGLTRGDAPGTSPFAPAWLDFCIVVAVLARNSVAHVLLVFRVFGLVTHLLNTMLLWFILAKLRPQMRVAAALFYGWNPLLLLVSVAGMHLEVVTLLLLLCAVWLFQRNVLHFAWVCIVLAGLTNLFCLLLLPFFLRLMVKQMQVSPEGRRAYWWTVTIVVTALLIVLAYVPYWPGWSFGGIGANLLHTFWQDSALNSLDATLLHLPVGLPAFAAWLAMPQHWMLFAALAVGCFLLLGLWLIDSLELLLLFSSLLFLSLLLLLPVYWPWDALIPLALALCANSRRTLLLALLLTVGAALSYYCWLWQPVWLNQGLLTIGLPLLVWGWTLFFIATRDMIEANHAQQPSRPEKGLSRPFRLSRPSLPSRSGRER